MNLDLGIIWIEDSYSHQEEENLRRRVREAGFIARVQVIPNGDRLEELAREHAFYHHVDLILLDYRLKDENGDELALKVRNLFPSTTILFYSGSAEEQDLRRMIAERQVEGVYCCGRGRFIDRAGALIEQTARSLDRLSGMRGLAMRVVAECDALMTEAILSMCSRDEGCAGKLGELDQDVLAALEEQKAKYEASTAQDLSARLETRAVDSTKLFKHFRRLTRVVAANPAGFGLDVQQVDRLRELRASSKLYDQNVLKKRNILGHVVEVSAAEGWVLQGTNEITVQDFPAMRGVFASHIDAFREMRGLVTLLDSQETK